MVVLAAVVAKQPGGACIVGQHQIGVAVVVDVPVRHPTADLREHKRSGLIGYLLEAAATQVLIEGVGLMDGIDVSPLHQILDHLHRAVADKQIEPTIVVEVEQRGPKAGVFEAGKSKTTGAGRFAEDPGPIVEIESVGLLHDVSHEEVLAAVTVDISGHHPHAAFRHALIVDRTAGDQGIVEYSSVPLIEPELIGKSVINWF